jgi:hypothetical protein
VTNAEANPQAFVHDLDQLNAWDDAPRHIGSQATISVDAKRSLSNFSSWPELATAIDRLNRPPRASIGQF